MSNSNPSLLLLTAIIPFFLITSILYLYYINRLPGKIMCPYCRTESETSQANNLLQCEFQVDREWPFRFVDRLKVLEKCQGKTKRDIIKILNKPSSARVSVQTFGFTVDTHPYNNLSTFSTFDTTVNCVTRLEISTVKMNLRWWDERHKGQSVIKSFWPRPFDFNGNRKFF
jgi:hypothetical protein